MRNKFLIPISIFLIAIIFFYGFSVGMYKIFPYEFLDSSSDALSGQKAIESNQFLNQADVYSLIKIDGESDIDQKRNFLTEFFWGVGGLQRVIDKSPLPQVEYDISDFRYSDFQNLERIDKLTVEMKYGINSISYLFIPEVSNEKLILSVFFIVFFAGLSVGVYKIFP